MLVSRKFDELHTEPNEMLPTFPKFIFLHKLAVLIILEPILQRIDYSHRKSDQEKTDEQSDPERDDQELLPPFQLTK